MSQRNVIDKDRRNKVGLYDYSAFIFLWNVFKTRPQQRQSLKLSENIYFEIRRYAM